MSHYELLTRPDQNPKMKKGMKKRYMTFPLHLAPADLSGYQVCPMATVCKEPCLNTAGRGRFSATQAARVRKTRWFFEDRAAFLAALVRDIGRARNYAKRRGYRLAIRLNATSDIPWHRVAVEGKASIMARFPRVQFYDYTKISKRLLREDLPRNYHLTFSADGTNDAAVDAVLAAGGNVAVVFRTRALVEHMLVETMFARFWHGAPVIDGDETDLRFLDPAGSVVALYAKGRAKIDRSGFVRD